MTLEEIKSELYKKEVNKELFRHEESEFDPRSKLSDPSKEKFVVEDAWEEKKGLAGYQKRAIAIGFFILAALFVVSGGLYYAYLYSKDAFKEERVSVKISGPDAIENGKEIDFEIIYGNNNRAALDDSVIRVYFPENFEPETAEGFSLEGTGIGRFELGRIKGHEEGKVAFKGRSFSSKGSLIYMKAEISYKPENLSSQFVTSDQLSMEVKYSPLDLQLIAPLGIPSGNLAGYTVKYRNNGKEDLENVEIRADLPIGFTFFESDPFPSEGRTVWRLGKLSPEDSGEIILRGKLEGNKEDVKVMRIEIGLLKNGEFTSYNKEKSSTKIEAAPMSISQTVNGKSELIANPGENLSFEINYKNEGDIDLGDVIVTEKLDSPLLDYGSMSLTGGSFDPATRTITWKASDHKELGNLSPGKEGKIFFFIKIKGNIPASDSERKNLSISGIAKADSPDIPVPLDSNKIVASNEIRIKIKTKINIQAEGYYSDKIIQNSGPIPPQVGQETTYAIHWKLFNVYNDVTDSIVQSTIPTGAIMTGIKFPQDESLTYNPRNNNLIWNVGTIPAGTGITTPPRELIFQIKIKPGTDQIGKPVMLTGPANFSGKDSFTGDDLSVKITGKTTELKEDASISAEASKVVP